MRLRALLLALAVLALAPAAASAHAVLESTTPERGARLASAPRDVVLRFNEPVEGSFGAVRVFDAAGRRVDAGTTTDGRTVTTKLRGRLADGGYTATYRVISADAHPVAGGFVFVVGEGAGPSATVDELLGRDAAAGPITGTALGAARALQYAAIALALGAFVFLLVAWFPGLREAGGAGEAWHSASAAFARGLRSLVLAAGVAGILSGATAIVLQGATGAGTSFWAAFDPDVIGEVLSTRFGLVWGLGLIAWALVIGGALAAPVRASTLQPASVGATGLALRSGPSWSLILLGLPLAALALLPGVAGHAGVQSPRGLLLPANALHVAAMGAWAGGVAVLALVLRRATASLDPPDRTRLLAAVVGRFSTLAGVAVALVLLTGVVQSIVEVASFGALIDTAFGRAVLIKLALFAALVGLGYVNRRQAIPALRAAAASGQEPGRAGALLRRTLRVEVAVFVAVLGVTGALATYAPSTAVSEGPFSTEATLGPARLEVTVEPARVGANEMHLYLFARSDGSQYDATKELTITASEAGKGIAKIPLDPTKAGPGHYVVSGASFGVAGDWTVTVTARVSDFDQHTTRLEVPIR